MSFVRSYQPKWFFNDLTGNPLDDSYYAHFLTNTLPYIPQLVYRDNNGATVWTGGVVQFEPSGGLPDNLYFDDSLVYRIEIRQGQSQFDPLIWEINDYVPEGDGNDPESFQLMSSNQITNPEFVDVYFNNTLTTTNSTVEIAPGWQLVCTGTGTTTINKIAVAGTDNIPTNPAYVLNIVTSGWTTARLRQRFNNNGALFKSTAGNDSALAGSFVAKSNGSDFASTMVFTPSSGSSFLIIPNATVTAAYQRFSDAVAIPNLPQNATNSNTGFINIDITLPGTGDVDISSIQLIHQQTPQALPYVQESPSRHRDQQFHAFKNEIIIAPKDSVLTGWDFSLNPWQFTNPALNNIAAGVQARYEADQTIIRPHTTNSLQVGRASTTTLRQGFEVKARSGASSNRFALIQYIDQKTIRPYWDYVMSSLVRARIFTSHGSQVGMKMRLLYRSSLLPTLSTTEPIASWGAGDPVFAAGWTALTPRNDPTWVLENAYATGEGVRAFPAYPFEHFVMPSDAGSNETLAIVLYTTTDMNATGGSEDYIVFDSISLVPSEFAVDTNPLTYDETLRRCEFYYEKSYAEGIIPGSLAAATPENSILVYQPDEFTAANQHAWYRAPILLEYKTIKRIAPSASHITLYDIAGNANSIRYTVYDGNAAAVSGGGRVYSISPAQTNLASTQWDKTHLGVKRATLINNTKTAVITETGAAAAIADVVSVAEFHYVIDCRMGI